MCPSSTRRSVSQMLMSCSVIGASIAVDGKQAIAATQNAEFDIVLMDIQMPEMDGFEATAEIREQEKLPSP